MKSNVEIDESDVKNNGFDVTILKGKSVRYKSDVKLM